MFRTIALATGLCLATLTPPPAAAEAQIRLSITPRTVEEAALLRFGLAAYALQKDIDANGHITQAGANNAAGISQGACDSALIEQRGRNHRGRIIQRNCGNVGALFQSGRGTDDARRQTGGATGLIFVHGF